MHAVHVTHPADSRLNALSPLISFTSRAAGERKKYLTLKQTEMAAKIDKMGGAQPEDEVQDVTDVASSSALAGSEDMLSLGQVDQALATKMHLVNDVSFFKRICRCQTYVNGTGNR
jgi:uncharacterized protein (DUF39 family)